MKVEMHVHNVEVLIKNLKSIGGGAPKYLDGILERCMKIDVWPLWIKEISYTDHSLADLAALGHPYSTNKPKDSFVHLDEIVHEQSGNLVRQSRIEKMSGQAVGYQLINTAPEYVYLRYGTSTMRPRDPGGAALRDALPAIRKRFASEVKGAIVQIIARG